jgi:hypothetical protein
MKCPAQKNGYTNQFKHAGRELLACTRTLNSDHEISCKESQLVLPHTLSSQNYVCISCFPKRHLSYLHRRASLRAIPVVQSPNRPLHLCCRVSWSRSTYQVGRRPARWTANTFCLPSGKWRTVILINRMHNILLGSASGSRSEFSNMFWLEICNAMCK